MPRISPSFLVCVFSYFLQAFKRDTSCSWKVLEHCDLQQSTKLRLQFPPLADAAIGQLQILRSMCKRPTWTPAPFRPTTVPELQTILLSFTISPTLYSSPWSTFATCEWSPRPKLCSSSNLPYRSTLPAHSHLIRWRPQHSPDTSSPNPLSFAHSVFPMPHQTWCAGFRNFLWLHISFLPLFFASDVLGCDSLVVVMRLY